MVGRVSDFRGKFPEEFGVIGRILTDYSELEITLMNCVQVVRNDLDGVLKAMFRARGEKQRIDVADGLGRRTYAKWGLEAEFAMGVGAMQHARKIRNQYAHSIWHDAHQKLHFLAMEDLARDNQPVYNLDRLTFFEISLPLLKEQEVYLHYADALLRWTNYEGRVLSKAISTNPFQKPPQRVQPDLYIR